MRETVRRLLIDGVESVQVLEDDDIDYVASRVVEPYAATKELAFPFLVMGQQTPDAKPSDYAGPVTRIEVWPVIARTTFVTTDEIKQQVKAALHEARFEEGDRQYYSEHVSTGPDSLDPTFGGLTRQIVFEVSDLTWLLGTTFAPDPIAALRAWTEAKWPPVDPDGVGPLPAVAQVQTNPTSWEPSAAKPGIYWRWAGNTRIVEEYPSFNILEARIVGHILTPSPAKRLEWTRRLHEALTQVRFLMLSDDAPMYIERVGADSSAHQIRQGQITVLVHYSVEITDPPAEPLDAINLNGDLLIP